MKPQFNVAFMLFYIFYPKFSCGVWSYLRNKKIGQERDLDFTMVVLQFSRPSSSPHKAGRRQLRPFEGGRQCAHACQCAFHSCLLITANKRLAQRNIECAIKEILNARRNIKCTIEEILNARSKKYWMRERRNIECTERRAQSHYSSSSGAGVKINRIWPIIQNKWAPLFPRSDCTRVCKSALLIQSFFATWVTYAPVDLDLCMFQKVF